MPLGLQAQMFNKPGMPTIVARGDGVDGSGQSVRLCVSLAASSHVRAPTMQFRERLANSITATFSSASSATVATQQEQQPQLPANLMTMLQEVHQLLSRQQPTPSLHLPPAELQSVLSSTPASSATSSTSSNKRSASIFDDMRVPKRRNTETAASNEPVRTVNVDDDGEFEDGQISQRDMRREADAHRDEARAAASETRLQAAMRDPAMVARMLAALPAESS